MHEQYQNEIRARAADVTTRADKIRGWKQMKHHFAVESGLRTQGLRAEQLAVDTVALLDEVCRLREAVSLAETYLADGAPHSALRVLREAELPAATPAEVRSL